METGDITFFKTLTELHGWFEKNHENVSELWIGFYKKSSGIIAVNYKEALDEALCFGWIDGIRKAFDNNSYTIRFTPRRKGSTWSKINTDRVMELTESGRMQSSGLKVFNEKDVKRAELYSYENKPEKLEDKYIKRFMQHKKAWEYFQSQPPSYRRTVNWWVMSAKKEETRLRRLEILISNSEEGNKIPQMRRTDENG
jgi:uncharacterized protein YdeI (YjbR/CyaY-like superfamily)